MRDIGTRIQRYRLSRYAQPLDRVQRRLRWAWVAGGLWLLYVGVLSEHSFYRLLKLRQENARGHVELQRTRAEIERLAREAGDPAAVRLNAERQLREKVQMAKKNEIIYRYEGEPPEPVKH
jgi:cell division protein FtsB